MGMLVENPYALDLEVKDIHGRCGFVETFVKMERRYCRPFGQRCRHNA